MNLGQCEVIEASIVTLKPTFKKPVKVNSDGAIKSAGKGIRVGSTLCKAQEEAPEDNESMQID